MMDNWKRVEAYAVTSRRFADVSGTRGGRLADVFEMAAMVMTRLRRDSQSQSNRVAPRRAVGDKAIVIFNRLTMRRPDSI
jgi:hypothetical protein